MSIKGDLARYGKDIACRYDAPGKVGVIERKWIKPDETHGLNGKFLDPKKPGVRRCGLRR